MWSDWHQDVREAALLALAKAGQGKVIHFFKLDLFLGLNCYTYTLFNYHAEYLL